MSSTREEDEYEDESVISIKMRNINNNNNNRKLVEVDSNHNHVSNKSIPHQNSTQSQTNNSNNLLNVSSDMQNHTAQPLGTGVTTAIMNGLTKMIDASERPSTEKSQTLVIKQQLSASNGIQTASSSATRITNTTKNGSVATTTTAVAYKVENKSFDTSQTPQSPPPPFYTSGIGGPNYNTTFASIDVKAPETHKSTTLKQDQIRNFKNGSTDIPLTSNNNNNNSNHITFTDLDKKAISEKTQSFSFSDVQPDGVKYKFVSHETIGGKTDPNANKFRCSKCTIM